MARDITVVRLERWQNSRLPSTHHLNDRWTLVWVDQNRPLLTFNSEEEARDAARRHGWRIDNRRYREVSFA